MRREIFKRSNFHGTLFQLVLLINLYAINGDEELQIEPTETRSTLRNDPECRSECLLSNTCGSWLENTSAKSGTYRLHQPLELSCQFLSAPTPVAVAWKFKTTTENVWRDVSCNVTTNYECNVTKLGEHRSTSFCTAENVTLEMGGIYRCETLDSKETVYSSEIRVDVVGIQSAVQISEHLHFGKPGHIEVQICSNPMAHPFWTDDEIVLQSSQSGNGLAVTSLLPARTESLLESGPTHHIPYCYVNRIIIAKVDERVKRLKLIVSLHEDMQSVDLSFHAKLKTKLKHQPRHNAASNHLYVCCSNLVMLLIVSIIYNKSY
uniref:Ig-like domain-containing protein n=1 Tax=Acrobeloides nanus TaxID=290746 RepID=A0A914EJM6_9BILA